MTLSHRLAIAALSLAAASAFAVTITPPGPGGAPMPFSAVGPAKVGKFGIDLTARRCSAAPWTAMAMSPSPVPPSAAARCAS